MYADERGELPAEEYTESQVEGVDLPPGEYMYAEDDYGIPRGWITVLDPSEALALWTDLVKVFSDSGLWPFLIEFPNDETPELYAETTSDTVLDPLDVLIELGSSAEPGWEVTELAAKTDDASKLPVDLELYSDEVALMLVPGTSPGDTFRTMGWPGGVNVDLGGDQLAAVLESWQERFGAYVTSLGFDTLILTVSNPPTEQSQTYALAAEHAAITPEMVYMMTTDREDYAQYLDGLDQWAFWWD